MILILAALIAVLYAGQMTGLASEWASSPDASYGAALACVAVVIAWQRRQSLALAINPNAPPLAGFVVLIVGLAVYLAGSLGADLFLTRASLVVVLAGLTWYLAGGRAVRVMTAPLLFLLLAIPLPALVVNAVTLPLQLVWHWPRGTAGDVWLKIRGVRDALLGRRPPFEALGLR